MFYFSLSQWTLISPTDVPRQADAIYCGVYACINAYSLVYLQLYPVSPFHINRLCYYIIHTANKDNSRCPSNGRKHLNLKIKKPSFMPLPIKRTFDRSTCRNSIKTIKMLVNSRLDERPSEEEEPFTSEKDDSSSSKSVHLEQSTEKEEEDSCQERTHMVKVEKTRCAFQFSETHLNLDLLRQRSKK